jgi:hypothetical protein
MDAPGDHGESRPGEVLRERRFGRGRGGKPAERVQPAGDAIPDVQQPRGDGLHQSPADKRKLLGTLVDRELIAQEARRRGYDRRPEIQKLVNDHITAALLRDDVDLKLKPEDVPDADLEKYYREHESEFTISIRRSNHADEDGRCAQLPPPRRRRS